MKRILMAITLLLTLTSGMALADDTWYPRPPVPDDSWYSSLNWVWQSLSFLL